MRNRAKCKSCGDLLESFHRHDFVSCKCGEISIEGGEVVFKCFSKNWENFIRIDDDGNEVSVKVVEKDNQEEPVHREKSYALGRKDKIKMLKTLTENISNLPESAMSLPVSHYDLYSFMLVVSELFSEELSSEGASEPETESNGITS